MVLTSVHYSVDTDPAIKITIRASLSAFAAFWVTNHTLMWFILIYESVTVFLFSFFKYCQRNSFSKVIFIG